MRVKELIKRFKQSEGFGVNKSSREEETKVEITGIITWGVKGGEKHRPEHRRLCRRREKRRERERGEGGRGQMQLIT